MNSPKVMGTSSYWGAPTRLTVPPSRTTPNDVSIASLRPTHSSTAWVPSPPVSSRDPLDALRTPFGYHVGGAELDTEIGAVLVPAHQDDPLSAEPLRCEHRRQADCAVAKALD